jgi:hypothetical protein
MWNLPLGFEKRSLLIFIDLRFGAFKIPAQEIGRNGYDLEDCRSASSRSAWPQGHADADFAEVTWARAGGRAGVAAAAPIDLGVGLSSELRQDCISVSQYRWTLLTLNPVDDVEAGLP